MLVSQVSCRSYLVEIFRAQKMFVEFVVKGQQSERTA